MAGNNLAEDYYSPEVLSDFRWNNPPRVQTTQSKYMLEEEEISWKQEIFERFAYLTILRSGWDSYSAKRINEDLAQDAFEILISVANKRTPKPDVIPTKAGGINIEWHVNNIDLEIEFTSLSDIEVYYDKLNDDEEPIEELLSADISPLVNYVNMLTTD